MRKSRGPERRRKRRETFHVGAGTNRRSGKDRRVQLDLLDEAHGAARHTDPPTSHAAAATVDVNRLERIIIDSLKQYGPLTMSEIAASARVPRDSLSPRTPRLVRLDVMVDTGMQRPPERFGCRERGMRRSQIVWQLTTKGSQA